MDLRTYYKKLREIEETLTGQHLVVVSLATSEGGKEGVRTDVPKGLAAKLLAEGRARVATEQESSEFYEEHLEARRKHEQDEAARRLQVMVIPSQDLRKPKDRS